MKKDTIVCIGTIGSPTFKKCKKIIDKLTKNHSRVLKVVVIKNKTPQSAWLNEMRKVSAGMKWCIQIDEDMYLYPNAINELIKFAETKEREGVKILNASSLLYDLFLKSRVGSLKIWSVAPLQELEFKDVLGGDRNFAKRAKKLGYRNVETKLVLGDHDSAPTAGVAFKKYFEHTQKIRKYSSEERARKFSRFLKQKWLKNKTFINKKAYDGSALALKSELQDKSKR
jgi:hypothetical protein